MNRIQKGLCALVLLAFVTPVTLGGIIDHPAEPAPSASAEPTPTPSSETSAADTSESDESLADWFETLLDTLL